MAKVSVTNSVLEPPSMNHINDKKSLVRWMTKMWTRTGNYTGGAVLKNLTASEAELNSLAGIKVSGGGTVQSQIDKKVGVIHQDTASYPNSGAGETTLSSYTIPGNTLDDNGLSIGFHASGTYAANANNKQIKIIFDSTTIFDTTALAANDGTWSFDGTIIRNGASSEKITTKLISSNATVGSTSSYVTASENLADDLVLRLTGTGVASSDIVQEIFVVKLNNQ